MALDCFVLMLHLALQKEALEVALKELQMKYGKMSIMRGSDIEKEPV